MHADLTPWTKSMDMTISYDVKYMKSKLGPIQTSLCIFLFFLQENMELLKSMNWREAKKKKTMNWCR